MNLAVLTSLYPSPPRPFEGVFAERRWQGMAQRGHQVHVVQPVPLAPGPFLFGRWAEIRKMPREEERGGIAVRRPRYFHVPSRARQNARRFARIGVRRLLAQGLPDAVVLDYAWPAAAAALGLAKRGIPVVINGRGSDVLQVAGEAGLGSELGEGLAAAGHWCAVSNDLVRAMDEVAAAAGATGTGTLVPNGVDLELFHPRERNEARHRLELPQDVPLVLVAGHLIERKDPLFALKVFEAGAPDDAMCVFVGKGRLKGALEIAVRERDLTDRVRIVGEVPPGGLADWYGAADLLLLTSHREGRPNVVLEALASGRPVLATDVGGTAELLGDHRERMLAPGHDVEAMAAMLRTLLAEQHDPMGLRRAVEHLSWDASLATLEQVLERARNTVVTG